MAQDFSKRLAAASLSFPLMAGSGLALSNTETEQARVSQETLVITGSGAQVHLTDEFAGGQVARGSRNGVLGNVDYMDSPFSSTAYTADFIDNQQAGSVGEVLARDPGVQLTKGYGNFQEVYMLRGFPTYSDDITVNGLYGILPRQMLSTAMVERVEVFRGSSAFVNGAAPGGSGVGGSINIIPKRPGNEAITDLSLGYEDGTRYTTAVDASRRFGEDEQWGVRVNGLTTNGEGSIEDEDRFLDALSLATDYESDNFLMNANLGYQKDRLDNPRPQVTPTGALPDAPDADSNYAQDGTYSEEEDLFGTLRGEWQLSNNASAWVAGGFRESEERNVLMNPRSTADGTLGGYRFDNAREDSVRSADAGVRLFVDGEQLSHEFVVSAAISRQEVRNGWNFSSFTRSPMGSLDAPDTSNLPAMTPFYPGGSLDNPQRDEVSIQRSLALADTLRMLDDRLALTLGLRYQDLETRDYDINTNEALSEQSAHAWTPALGVVYALNPEVSLYANYAENLQKGSSASSTYGAQPVTNAGSILDPFRGEQMEAGVKLDLGNLGATFSLFTVNRQNGIYRDNGNGSYTFTNDGERFSQGVEITTFGEPVPGLRLLGGLTWIDATYEDTQDGINDGKTAIGVPEWQAKLSGEYSPASLNGITFDAGLIYTGSQQADLANTQKIDAWTRVDTGVRYVTQVGQQQLTLRARVENLFDESYWSSVGGSGDSYNYLTLGSPRTLSLNATLSF